MVCRKGIRTELHDVTLCRSMSHMICKKHISNISYYVKACTNISYSILSLRVFSTSTETFSSRASRTRSSKRQSQWKMGPTETMSRAQNTKPMTQGGLIWTRSLNLPEADATVRWPWNDKMNQNEHVVCRCLQHCAIVCHRMPSYGSSVFMPLFDIDIIDNEAMDEFITKCESSSPEDWSKAWK